GPIQFTVLEAQSPWCSGCPCFGSTDCHLTISTSPIPLRPLLPLCGPFPLPGRLCADGAEGFTLHHHCPDDARHLVGQRHGRHRIGLLVQQLGRPSRRRRFGVAVITVTAHR